MMDNPAKTQNDFIHSFARSQAIQFAKFVGNRPIPEYSESTDMWRWWNNMSVSYDHSTTSDLYSQFLDHQKKQQEGNNEQYNTTNP